MLAPAPLDRRGGAEPALDVVHIERLRGVRGAEQDRIPHPEPEIRVLYVVVDAPAGAPRDGRDVLREPAEVVLSAPKAERDAAGVIVPDHRLQADREPVAPGPGAEVAMKVEVGPGRRGQRLRPLESEQPPVVEHVPVVRADQRIEQHLLGLRPGLELDPLALGEPVGPGDGRVACRQHGHVLGEAAGRLPHHLDPRHPPLAPARRLHLADGHSRRARWCAATGRRTSRGRGGTPPPPPRGRPPRPRGGTSSARRTSAGCGASSASPTMARS